MKAYHYFDFHAQHQPDAEFAGCHETRVTYSEARDTTNRVAHAMIAYGMKPGDRVAFLMKNSIETVVLYLGAFKAGTVPVPINHRLKPAEWLRICEDSEAKLLISDAQFAADVDAFRSKLESVHCFIIVAEPRSGWIDFASWTAQQSRVAPSVSIREEDDLLQMYTSGTTGQPRRVVLTHRSVTANIAQLRLVSQLCPSDRFLLLMPLFHAAGVITMLHTISWGASLFIQQRFVPEDTVDALDKEGVTTTMMVPAMIHACLSEVSDITARNFEKLRLIIYGASPMDEETMRQAMELFGCDFAQRYGTTETLSLAWLSPVDHQHALENKPELLRSAGRPLPGTRVRVVDEDSQDVPTGESGEIVVSGPQLMQGYWRPDNTTNFDTGGQCWMHTGDAGFIDAEGYIYICDRVKDVIVSGGENIYPREIEEVLIEHPDVVEAAVIGVPDNKWGETVKAIVALHAQAEVSAEQLIGYCRARLAGFKTPRSIDFMSPIPRNSSGKILKSKLREPYWQGHDRRV